MAENGLDGEIKKVRTFKSELLEAKKAYENLVLTKAPSEDIAAAAAKLAELKDEADDANSAVVALTGAGKFQAVTKSIAAVAGGFSAVQGAIGLAGGASEDFQKTIQKVQSAMALTQGLTALEDVGDSFKNLGSVASDTFKKLGTNAKGSFSVIRAGLATTGITLLIPILVSIIENFDRIKEAVMSAFPALKAFGDFITNAANAVKDFFGLSSEEERGIEARVEAMKGMQKNAELVAKQLRAEGKERRALAVEEKQIATELQLSRDKFSAAKTQKDKAAAAAEIKELKVTLAVKKAEIGKYEKEEKDKKDKADSDAAEKAKTAREKELAKEKAYQDKRRELLRTNELAALTDERQIAEKRQQFAYEDRLREISALEISEKKKAYLRELALKENENSLAKIKKDFDDKDQKDQEKKAEDLKKYLANTEEEKLQLQIEAAGKAKDELLKNDKLTKEQRAEIEKAYLLQVEQLTNESKAKIAAKELQDAQKLADDKLSKEKVNIARSIEAGTMSIKEAKAQERQIEEQALEDKLAIAKKYNVGAEEAELALLAFKKKVRDEDRQAQIDNLNAAFDLASQLGTDIMALNEQRTQKLLADETLTAEERNKIALKQFESAKRMQYALAVIDGAKAITAILSVPDFTLGIASGIRLAAAAASTAFSLAKISQTQFQPPSSSAGSKFEEGGLLVGPSHDRGGIRNYFGEMEGGEFVVNRQSSAAFLPLLEQINSLGNGNSAMAEQPANYPMQQPIIKTYVVASEVSSQQEADKRISDLAAL